MGEVAKKGSEVLKLRQSLHLTQHALALRLGVTKRTVSRWESGVSQVHPVYLERIRELRNGRK